ncbi:hypothetical protein HDV06_006328 [Boothiomyces sp. JEL0866]|nr:hypothetical protein HDV06_006328 [Boothiomyces sp. JEL0866]
MILEIMHRFPHNEALRKYSHDLMTTLMQLLLVDNEENGVLCLKIIVDLHKNYTALMEDQVQPFLNLVRDLYCNMEQSVAIAFSQEQKTIPKSMNSFKVPMFVEPIIKVLLLQPPQQQMEHMSAANNGTIFLGMSPSIKNPTLYSEYKSLQVKTVSFLAYIIRSFIPILKPYQDQIAEGVITLMKDCPGDSSTTRKELLSATRHLWFTEFRNSFVPYIDILLNDDVLIGTGVTCKETLRPIAYSVLMDLIHHVRSQISLAQISRIITIFSRNLQDVAIQPQIQTMCAKLLLSLVENISVSPNRMEARPLFVRILDALGTRLTSLRDTFPTVLVLHNKKNSTTELEKFGDLQELTSFIDVGLVQPIRITQQPLETTNELLKEMRTQFKTVLLGIKTTLFSLRTFESQDPSQRTHLLFCQENDILIKIFKHGLDCFEYCFVESGVDKTTALKDDKEVVEAFASIYTYVDPATFQEVCTKHIEYLFEKTISNHFILAIPQYFLCNNSVSSNFAGPLLRFLMDKFSEIGGPDTIKANVMLRLFKLLFMAVSLFPEQNEKVLQPHLANIIMSSLKVSSKAQEPLNYFLLLRGLFRSIGGGKFELLYQEVLPLLQVLLESLNSLLQAAHKPQMKELFVELCLTVPVRLSVLLPHLSYLMKPLVIALHGGPDLVSQSLRTLELCIDNLNHEFLEPIFAPVKEELMSALWKHLKPVPYNQVHAHTTLRILGKFGGRNRKIIRDQSTLGLKAEYPDALSLNFTLSGTNNIQEIELGETLIYAYKQLVNSTQKFHIEKAFTFVKSCMPLYFDLEYQTIYLNPTISSLVERFKNTDFAVISEQPEFVEGASLNRTRTDALERSFTKWISTVIVASTIPDTQEEAWQILEHLGRHFTILAIEETITTPRINTSRNVADTLVTFATSKLNGFLRAILDSLSDEKLPTRESAEKLLIFFYNSCKSLVGKDVQKIACFQVVALWFASHCYQLEWFKKTGGCIGLSIICSKLDFEAEWMVEHEIEFVQALLYVLKDVSADVSYFNISNATDTLYHILRVCNQSDQSHKFNSLISVLISELSNSNLAVRKTVQTSLGLLAELTGKSVTDILMPVKDRLLYPIFAKPLRALTFALQMGYIDAITYCLSLQPPLVSFTDELGRLLHEALALAEAEDQALSNKDNQYKTATSANNLRVECIKLLSAVMACSDMLSPKHTATRNRIIQLFFKCLYSKSPEVIQISYIGLKEVLANQQRLPKDLLQAGLKPILVNLSDYKKLTVPGLEGLSRLLELLTNYFRVEIGRRLLDHIKNWADPQKLKDASARPLMDIEDISIIAAIVDIFHLLPPAANCFMDELVTQVIELESQLHRSTSSPFRPPLCRYLNKYSSEALEYFLGRSSSALHMNLFISLLKYGTADELLTVTLANSGKIQSTFFTETNGVFDSNLYIYGILLIKTLSDSQNDWIVNNRQLLDLIVKLWKSKINIGEVHLQLNHPSILVLELIIHYCNNNTEEVALLFDLMDGFLDDDILDTNFLRQFIFKLGTESNSARIKGIFSFFLQYYVQPGITIRQKSTTLRYLIIPMLMIQKNDCDSVYDSSLIENIMLNMWSPAIQDGAAGDVDALRVALLQLTTLLLYQVPEITGDYRKEVIKFAWGHLKMEDVTVKESAYVLLCRFIKEFDTPSKIVIQTYVAQLRAHQLEGRSMVKQALDSIIPVLPTRSGMNAAENSTVPLWVQWIRKIIIEDGHSVSQLVSVYQLIIRNSDSFFPCREHVMPQIVSSLARLGLSGNSTAETRLLSVDLASLIVKWERQAQVIPSEDEMAVDQPEGSKTGSNVQELIIAFLIRFCLALTDPQNSKPLFPKALENLESCLQIWPDALVALNQLEKAVQLDITDGNVNLIVNAAEIVNTIVHTKSLEWISENVGLFQRCVEKWGATDNAQLLAIVSKIITRVCECLDSESVPGSASRNVEKQNFLKAIDARVHDKLKTGVSNIVSTAAILDAAYYKRIKLPSAVQSIRANISDMVRILQSVVNITLENLANETNLEEKLESIKVFLLIINNQMHYLGESRRIFITIITQLLENSEIAAMHKVILDMVRKWILDNPGEAFPTIKEKSSLAVKLFCLQSYSNSPLYEEYLNFVADIYEDETLLRTEITVRLEHVFLEGTKHNNPTIRCRFSDILNKSIPTSVVTRLKYIISVQNWQSLSESFWISQALDLMMCSIITDQQVYNCNSGERLGFVTMNTNGVESISPEIEDLVEKEKEFFNLIKAQRLESVINPIRHFIYDSVELSYTLWVKFFPIFWNNLDFSDKHDQAKSLIGLLANDYHQAQVNSRPNVIQALLEGVCKTNPPIRLPPQLVKYLGKTYNAWHIAMELLQDTVNDEGLVLSGNQKDDEKIRDSFMDALADIYSELSEEDYFAGIWRRRCLFPETNAAISFEQAGMWQAAQRFYESAQAKARTCVLPFTESEYYLWEKQWIKCTERLQQWDILCDLSKHDSDPELLLECAWRLSDWNVDRDSLNMTLQSVIQPYTPRKKLFQAFLILNRLNEGQESVSEFQKVCEEGMQLTLKKWYSLPSIISSAHIPTFHTFQQFVELQEACSIQTNLLGTNAQNIDSKSQELKNILSTWRDRLPNVWDDMNIWSDLVAWRQHVFTAINKAYLPLIPHIAAPPNGGSPTSSYAYRGYHETAWIINRFAHVARKHRLPDVCISSLGKIYTLPNIEIQEAFFKLREQAKCHKDVLGEDSIGLDVINNTNLLYFNAAQKSEFFALRGSFLAKLALHDDATQAFSSAIQVDVSLPIGWASFGEYNDRMFDNNPNEMKYAADAINSYLHASEIYNNNKSRKYLSRILWLLSLDDNQGQLMKGVEAYKADPPVWYWITFIPELIGCLSGKEAKFAKTILIKIAKTYPQSLHFQLRTAKEDFAVLKSRVMAQAQSNSATSQSSQVKVDDKLDENGDVNMEDSQTENKSDVKENGGIDETQNSQQTTTSGQFTTPTPWDSVEEVMGILKTAFPLLALTMEKIVDQILVRLKPATDEDIYRLIVALLNDGVQMYISQLPKFPDAAGPLYGQTEASLQRFAESMTPNHAKYKEKFEKDFIQSKPNLAQLVEKFRIWRDNLEVLLDSRPKTQNLEHFTQYLAEFEYSKFDEVEVPGQYFGLKTSNKDFVRIERFDPLFDIFRNYQGCYRRLVIRGHDGSTHPFILQHPATKQCRREEKTNQFFRLLNDTLDRRIGSRSRNLYFSLPIVVPLAPQTRLVQDDPSNVSLQEIYEDYAKKNGFKKDDPIIYYTNRLKEVYKATDCTKKTKNEMAVLKCEINQEISDKMIPDSILSNYFVARMATYEDLWTIRKRFTNQMACITFMTFLLSVGQRQPQKFNISCEKGNVWQSEFYSTISSQTFLFSCNEAIPFRLTPNIQKFISPIGLEGLFSNSLVTIANALNEPDVSLPFTTNDLRDYLSLFVRDELLAWHASNRKPQFANVQRLRELVNQNVEQCLKRVQLLSCKVARSQAFDSTAPVNQSVLDLISNATNPLKLAQMDILFLPQL